MRYKTIIWMIGILLVIPSLSADCPEGFICGGGDIEVSIAGGLFCSSNGETWSDYTDPSNPVVSPSLGLGNCYKPTAIEEKFCCPVGSECIGTGTPGPGGELYNCIYTDRDFCHKLDNEDDCNDYTKWVAVNSIETIHGEGYCGVDEDSWWDVGGGESCWNEIICSCEWDATESKCNAIDTAVTSCVLGGRLVPDPGECTYILESWEDKCDVDGLIYASWTASGEGVYGVGGAKQSECVDTGVMAIPCEQIVKLDFFTIFNVIVVVLILILIYYSYLNLKKK